MARSILDWSQSAPFLKVIGQTARVHKSATACYLSSCQAGLLKESHCFGNPSFYEEFLWANAKRFVEPALQAAKRLSASIGQVQHGNVSRKFLADNHDCLGDAFQNGQFPLLFRSPAENAHHADGASPSIYDRKLGYDVPIGHALFVKPELQMLDPIDFAQLYMAQQQKAQQGQGNAKPNETDGDTPNIILPN